MCFLVLFVFEDDDSLVVLRLVMIFLIAAVQRITYETNITHRNQKWCTCEGNKTYLPRVDDTKNATCNDVREAADDTRQ